jgi:hypothetical protein
MEKTKIKKVNQMIDLINRINESLKCVTSNNKKGENG